MQNMSSESAKIHPQVIFFRSMSISKILPKVLEVTGGFRCCIAGSPKKARDFLKITTFWIHVSLGGETNHQLPIAK
jgi:hypothetical protein